MSTYSATKMQNQLKQAIKYLSQRTNKDEKYSELIELLKNVESEITNEQIKILLVSQEQQLIDRIKNISENEKVESLSQSYLFTSTLLTNAFEKIDQNFDFVLLILNSEKPLKTEEKNLIKRAIAKQVIFGIIVKQDTIDRDYTLNLAEKDRQKITIYHLCDDNQNQYKLFFTFLLERVLAEKELKFKQKIINTINQYFERSKKTLWQTIQQRKELFLVKKNPEQVQQLINQLPHRCNRLVQNYLRVFKQNNNQNKLNLINPFCSDSLMYHIQNTIQDADVISQPEKQKVYLSLVFKKIDCTQAIHLYLIDRCQQSLSTWLREEWQNIETYYNNGGLHQLQKELQQEIQPLVKLGSDITLIKPNIQPQLKLENYICLSALENNSKIPFDYHYSQSTWFRLLVAVGIGTIIYLLIEHLFGFILLFVQIVNLITGQDARSIRLRQHTKEMKRIIDGKYQFLIRFLADKLVQDFAIALDDINQDYQEQIETITHKATVNLNQLKDEIALDREKIDELKQTQLKIQSIFS